MKNQSGITLIELMVGFVFATIVGLFLAVGPILSHTSEDYATITVKNKERICEGGKSGSCKYLIFTEQGVYSNVDDLYQLKFNSSDIYNEIEVGQTYDVKVNWYRVPFMSWYQNILEIK